MDQERSDKIPADRGRLILQLKDRGVLMKFSRFLELSVLALLIGGCANTSNLGTTSGQAESNTSSMDSAKAIDLILYSNSSREALLAKLQPYVTPMESMDDVKKKLELGFCFGSGPGVQSCDVFRSGLSLVFDPDKKLRLIRRNARVVDGVSYPEMSITDRGFEWHGYQRWYAN